MKWPDRSHAKLPYRLIWVLLALSVLGWLAEGYISLPLNDHRTESTAFTDGSATAVGRAIAPQLAAHPGLSGIHPLADGRDAFAARMLMVRAAERSLDIQYYIWRQDLTGTLLFDALRLAADRGVRVRLLLDDNNTSGLEAVLAALDTHPNIEVRLFNPFARRGGRKLQFLTDFSRLNRRMHNKSFTADNQVTVVGGRNIGDGYFGAANGVVFADLDVLAIGPAVEQVSKEFDLYWAAPSSYPAARLLPAAQPAGLELLASAAAQALQGPAATEYTASVRGSAIVERLQSGDLDLQWASTRMVSDPPDKVLDRTGNNRTLLYSLSKVIGNASQQLQIVSPYFVPTDAGVEALVALRASGVQIQILTNSLEATDVAVVHAGYAKHRKALLQAGVRLFELRRAWDAPKANLRSGIAGSSASSLHAKTFAVDGARVFVGSFNFDPRSADLNTELGFVIESPKMAKEIAQAFQTAIPAAAYEVRQSGSGGLVWLERVDGSTFNHQSEPGAGPVKRALIGFLSLLPIDWLL